MEINIEDIYFLVEDIVALERQVTEDAGYGEYDAVVVADICTRGKAIFEMARRIWNSPTMRMLEAKKRRIK